MLKTKSSIETRCSTVQFRIDVDFPKANVDMVYHEMRARGVQTAVPTLIVDFEAKGGFGKKAPKFQLEGDGTPTEVSVDWCLQWLAGFVDRRAMQTTTSKWDHDWRGPLIQKTSSEGMVYMSSREVKTELEELGVTVESWYGLMMGTCHLVCEVEVKKYSRKLVKQAEAVVQSVFEKFIVFHKPTKKVGGIKKVA